MRDASQSGKISDEDQLARFVIFGKWVREDKTLRPDAFMPPNDLDLSVTRHGGGMTEEDLWRVGHEVAGQIKNANLRGRADILARNVLRQNLRVEAAPLTNNANHVHINGWPPDKPAQKALAQQLASDAQFVSISTLT